MTRADAYLISDPGYYQWPSEIECATMGIMNERRLLPEPGSEQLKVLPSEAHRLLYAFLYDRREHPPTMRQIRAYLADRLDEPPAQTDRRVRELRDYFDVPAERIGQDYRYALKGWSARQKPGSRRRISGQKRAKVLAPGRCAQCGRTPLEHHVVLVVDHKIPRHWGGTDQDHNLQPLCEECNAGKQAYYATYDEYSDEIRQAADQVEPHKRIGELLKAFNGTWVPSDLIGVVASALQYQSDWRRRTRELRILGWEIETRNLRDSQSGRIITFYRTTSWRPWPEGSVSAEIRRLDPSNKRRGL